MADNNSDDEKKASPPMPTFSGNVMPMNISVDVDDDIGEETTRRIGGATFNPTFEPVSFAPSLGPASFATMNTTQQKGGISMAPPPPPIMGGWKLSSAPILPEFHPLERTSVFVPHTTASEVAERVADVLRDRSIEAHFDNTKAKAKCITSYNVDFRVFLYRGQKQYSHGTIVEVQRRFGASVLFVKDTQAILEAAQGKVPPPPSFNTAEIPLVSDTEDDDDYDDSNASLSSLDFVAKMLNFNGYDANLLALQTLSSLTDPAKMGRSTSKRVSQALIEPNNVVGAKVFGFVVDKKSIDEQDGVRNLAMTIVANVMQAVGEDFISGMTREALRPVLLEEVNNAEKNPQMAYMAARCLEPLIKGDHNAADLYSALDNAQNVGEARHAMLRDQAEKCIRKIDESR